MNNKRYNEAIEAVNYLQKAMTEEGIEIDFCQTQVSSILENPIITAIAIKKMKTFVNALEKIMNISNAYLEAKINEATEVVSEEVVDLDKLLEEQNQNQPDDSENEIVAEIYSEDNEEHNSALEDFLSAYNYEDEEEIKEEEPTVEEGSFDEELYNKYINDDSLRFSKDDIDNIKALINSEISDEALKNPEKFLVSKPPQEKKIKDTLGIMDYAKRLEKQLNKMYL